MIKGAAFFILNVGLAAAASGSSSKRGLVFVPNSTYPQDNQIWVQAGSDLTWYYNYQDIPSPAYTSIAQSTFEFVPMMWGLNASDPDSDSFYKKVTQIISNRQINITHVLSYNEPDASVNGGSDISPEDGARGWVANMIPLQKLGIKAGLPACTGQPYGLTWTQEFLSNCSSLISNSTHTANCTFDFMPVHWYDNFAGLESHINQRLSYWPNTTIWVTEFAYANQDLKDTLDFYNEAIPWLDNNTSVERYSYFGAFRSQNSNVGPNAAFLNRAGALTDIGSWYLGGSKTNVDPESSSSLAPHFSPPRIFVGISLSLGLLLTI
ncbi:hypothetical protein TD95_001788 [Thielaviopsis punctulata]|uniref:Asl1-like glycosyl hydrolase catalytic domain-containing protein n=1 Tax=Thielaviopsis punctulata TaxID=72032 RepID=A0A0F4ZLI6_9PEZI|nr:hypothetical protein TD95_001788 [Thielaviopsis punctulata]